MTRFFSTFAFVLAACSSGGSVVTFDRSEDPCEDDLPPACGTAPRCLLDDAHYVAGTFPGGRAFVVHTDGAATLNIEIQLTVERSPGTVLQVVVYESDCSNTYKYDTAGANLFRVADQDGILLVPITVSKEGDHPIEIKTDAYTNYVMIVNVDPTT